MFVNTEFTELLRLFNGNRVRYLVIGGYAIILYQGLIDPNLLSPVKEE